MGQPITGSIIAGTYPAVSHKPVEEPDVLEVADEEVEQSTNEREKKRSSVSSDEGRAQLVAQEEQGGYSTVRYTCS